MRPGKGARESAGLCLFASVFPLFLLASAPACRAQTWVSPLRGDLGVHDPVMIKQGSTYYMFATGNGVSVKTSPDRVQWKNAGQVMTAMPAWHKTSVSGNTGHLWAPDIHFRDGKYWLYYSVSTFGSRVSAIGLRTNATLDPNAAGFNWQDQGVVVSSSNSNDYNAIDPNVIVDSTGAPWMSFGSWWTGIKMFKLNPATGKIADGAQILSLASRSGSSSGIEAPFIIRHGGYYYLWVSFDVCCDGVNSTYNIRVGRSAQLTGPYADKAGKKMTEGGGTLIDDGDARWKGPGHNAIYTEGDSTFLVNHAYDADNDGQPTLQIRALYYDAQGWPTLDKSQSVPTSLRISFKPRRIPDPGPARFFNLAGREGLAASPSRLFGTARHAP